MLFFLCIQSQCRKILLACLNVKSEGIDLEFHFQSTGTVSRFYFQMCNRRDSCRAQLPVQFPFSGRFSSSGSALLWLSVFLNIVSRFFGFEPKHRASVVHWGLHLRASFAARFCLLCPYSQQVIHGKHHSLLTHSALTCLSHVLPVISNDLKSPLQQTSPKMCFREDLIIHLRFCLLELTHQ